MSDQLHLATRQEIVTSISYGLNFDRNGKSTRRYSAMMAQLAAEALADILERSHLVILKKPPARSTEPRGVASRLTE